MGKGLLEWWGRLKKWAGKKAKTASFWLVLLASLVLLVLLWVAFGSEDNCRCHCVCWLLGVTDKTEAIKLLGLAIAGVMAAWGVVAANRRSDAMADTAKAANNTANATEAGNRQQAFKDGVEHLGNDKPSVRQGGGLRPVPLGSRRQGAARVHRWRPLRAHPGNHRRQGLPRTEQR